MSSGTNHWENWDYTNPIQPIKTKRVVFGQRKVQKVEKSETNSFKKFSFSKVEDNIQSSSPSKIQDEMYMGIYFADLHPTTITRDTITIQTKQPVKITKGEVLTDEKIIGRGSRGKVVLVHDNEKGILFAQRVMKKEWYDDIRSQGRNCRELLIEEVEKIKNVDHPYIVKLRGCTQTPTKLKMLFDFVPGKEVFLELKEESQFSIEKIRRYAAQMISAVGYLHQCDMLIGMIEPQNFVLDEFGNVIFVSILGRLGVSTLNQTFSGSPEFIAPEILLGEGFGKGVDWWNMGLLIYEMKTGLPPFYSENVNEMYERILYKPLHFPKKKKKNKDDKNNDVNNVKEEEEEIDNIDSLLLEDLLKKMLIRDPVKRIGFEEIKQHSFFKGFVDWHIMEKYYQASKLEIYDPDIDDRVRFVLEKFTGEYVEKKKCLKFIEIKILCGKIIKFSLCLGCL